jgi:hypothetical protein
MAVRGGKGYRALRGRWQPRMTSAVPEHLRIQPVKSTGPLTLEVKARKVTVKGDPVPRSNPPKYHAGKAFRINQARLIAKQEKSF